MNTLSFRVNDEELKLFNQKVKEYNIPKQSYFLFTALDKPLLTISDLDKLVNINNQMRELVRQTKGIANNINQLTRRCHLEYTIPTYEHMVNIQNEFKIIRNEEEKVWQSLRQLIAQLKTMGL